MDDQLLNELRSLGEEPEAVDPGITGLIPQQEEPQVGVSDTARQVEPAIRRLVLQHALDRAATEAESVTNSREHRGLLGDSFGVLEEDARQAWFDEFREDIEASRQQQNRNEQITERGKAFWSRVIGAEAAEALTTTPVFGLTGVASGEDVDREARREIARREERVRAIEEGREERATLTPLRAGVENVATGLTGIASGIVKGIGIGAGYAGMGLGFDVGPDDNVVHSLGKWIDAKARQMFPGDPARQEEFSQKLAQGAGSMLGFYGPAILGKLMGASERVLVGITAATGALAEGTETFEQATESRRQGREVTEAKRLLAYMGGLVLGTSEALPIANFLEGGKGGLLRSIHRQGAEEALQEGGQTLGENVLARLLHDPERQIFKDVGENAAIGYILGGFMQGAQLAASPRARAQARRGTEDGPPATRTPRDEPPSARETTIDLDPYAPFEEAVEPEGERPADERPLEPLAPDVRGQDAEGDLAASMVPRERAEEPRPDVSSDGFAAPTFDDIASILPRDANQDPDFTRLITRMQAEFGKTGWNNLTPDEKVHLYRVFGGDPEPAPELAHESAVEAEPAPEAVSPTEEAEAAPAPNEAQETAISDDTRQAFREILAGKAPRRQWAQQLGVSEDQLQDLIDEAVQEGLLRVDRNGVVRRTARAKQAAPAAPQPTERGTVREQRQAAPARTARERRAAPEPEAPRPAEGPSLSDAEQAVGRAILEAFPGHANRLMLRDLLPRVPSLTKAQFDRALLDLQGKGLVTLFQIDNVRDITEADRAAAVPLGAGQRHFIFGDEQQRQQLEAALSPARPEPSPAPSRPSLAIPPEIRLRGAVEARERITGKPINAIVLDYAARIEEARGTDAFDSIMEEIRKDRLFLKADAHDLAALVGYPVPKSATKKAALDTVERRHREFRGAEAKNLQAVATTLELMRQGVDRPRDSSPQEVADALEDSQRGGEALAALTGLPRLPETPSPPVDALIITAIEREIDAMLPADVAARVVDRINHPSFDIPARFLAGRRMIELALTGGSPAQILQLGKHEVIHALRMSGLFTQDEWHHLVSHAKKINIDEQITAATPDGKQVPAIPHYREFYRTSLSSVGLRGKELNDAIEELIDQERVAKMAEQWVAREAKFGRAIDSLLDRVRQFIEAIARALNSLGIRSLDDYVALADERDVQRIAERVLSGEVGGRPLPEQPALPIGVQRMMSAVSSQEGRATLDALRGARPAPVSDLPSTTPPGIADVIRSIRASGQGVGIPLRRKGFLVLPEGDVSALAIRAFHGSPYDFDRFDMSKIGTGEGAQAYGHGLYFAEAEGVARSYRDALQHKAPAKVEGVEGGARYLLQNAIQEARKYPKADRERVFREWLDETEQMASGKFAPPGMAENVAEAKRLLASGEFVPDLSDAGRMYEVNIRANPDEFLDWDKPLSQQSEKVKEAVRKLLKVPEDRRGESIIMDIGLAYGRDRPAREAYQVASEKLREAGIPGIRYLDQGSRAAGEGSYNYVVFDDSIIEIVAKDGQPVSREDFAAASIRSVPEEPSRSFNIEGFSGTVTSSVDENGNRVRTYRVVEEGTAPAAQVVNRGVSMPRRSIESVELLEAPGYVYRAGVSAKGEYWARDLGVAIAYRHNPGFGGERIYRTKLPENLNILDLRRNDVHHQWLEETLGDDYMERYETEAWATASPDAIKRLEVDGYDGVMYLDDYPDGAETIFIPGGLTGDEIEVPILEGLLFWKKSGWDTRGYANDEITVYLIDKLYEKDSDTGEFELLAKKYSFGTRLVRNIVYDLSYDEFETLLNGGAVRYRGDEIVLRDGMVSSAPPPSRGSLSLEGTSPVAFAVLKEQDDGSWSVSMVRIEPDHRGQGVPSRLFRAIEEDLGQRLAPQGWLTAEQYAELAESNPDAVRYHQPAGPAFDDMWVSPKQMEFGAEILKEFAGETQDARAAREALDQARQLEAMRALVPQEAFEQERAQQELRSAMLDMSPEARRARAEAMGFDTSTIWYHGTKAKFDAFDLAHGGRATGAKSALQAIFFASKPDIAGTYARGAKIPGLMQAQAEAEARLADLERREAEANAQLDALFERRESMPEADYIAAWNAVLATKPSLEDIIAARNAAIDARRRAEVSGGLGGTFEDASIIPVYARIRNPLVDDRGGRAWHEGRPFSEVLAEAKEAGHDAVIFRNVYDAWEMFGGEALTGDVLAIFDPANIRSVNAVFDPAQAESPLIMASLRGLPHPMQLGDPRRSGLEPPERSLSDLVSAVTDALGLTVRHGRLSPGLKARAGRLGMAVAGQFSRATGVTRIAIPNDLATLAHEGGHALETRMSTRDDVRQLQDTYAEELITPPSRNYAPPQMPASGYSGIDLDADTQQVLLDAIQADVNLRTLAVQSGQQRRQFMARGQAATQAAFKEAQREAAMLRNVLIRRLGQQVADAVIKDVQNAAPQNLQQYIAQRFSVNGVPSPRPPLPQASREALSEGWAEFFRMYVTSPREAQIQAPRLYHAFEDMLDGTEPEMLEQLQEVQRGFQELKNASPAGAVMSRVQSSVKPSMFAQFRKDLAEKGPRATISDKLYTFYHAVVDGRHPMKRAVKFLMELAADNLGVQLGPNERMVLKAADDPYKLWRLAEHSKVWATATLQNGVRLKGEAEPQGPSFHEALSVAFGGTAKGQWNEERAQQFGSYLVARRMLAEWRRYERGELENPPDSLIEKRVWQKARQDIEKAHPEFARAAQLLYQFNKRHLQNKYLNGFISKDLYLELNAREDYVPLNRMMNDNGPSALTKPRGQNKRKLIYRFKGSTRDFINPLESIAQDVYATQARFALNDVISAMDRLSRAVGPGGGVIAERIPPTDIRGTRVDIREAMKQAAKDLDPNDAQGLMDMIDDLFDQEASATIFRAVPTEEKGEPIVYLWEEGKRVPIRLGDNRIARDIFETMVALGRNNAEPVIDALAMGTQAFRFGVTKAPSYIMVNFLRDQLATWVLSRDYVPFWSGAKGLKNVLANDTALKRYQSFAGISGIESGLIEQMAGERDVMTLRRKGALASTSKLGTFMRAMEITELASRVGHFESAYQRALKDGFTPEEAAIEAAYAAHDVLDFSRRGAKMNQIARIVAFGNSALQGLDAFARTIFGERDIHKNYRQLLTPYIKAVNGSPLSVAEKEALPNSVRVWVKLVGIGMIGVALAALYRDDEEYEEFNDYMKATHWFFKVGGVWWRVPKPFELAVVSNIFESAFDRWWRQDERAHIRFLEAMRETFLPPAEVQGLAALEQIGKIPSALWERYVAKPPFSKPSDADIPQHLRALPPEMQFTAYTSELGKMLGALLKWSPAQIDNFITNTFATMGRDVLAASDQVLPQINQLVGGRIPGVSKSPRAEKSIEDYWFVSRFARRASRGALSSQYFWQQMSLDGGKYIQAANGYKELLKSGDEFGAKEFLSTLDDERRAYALLEGHFKEQDQDIHPMNRARQVIGAMSGIRREMVLDRLVKQSTANKRHIEPEKIVLSPSKQKIVNEILEDLAMREARNALIVVQHPGWKNKEILPTDGLLAELKAAVPEVAEELDYRLNKGRYKVYPFEGVRKAWPKAKEALLKEGADAILAEFRTEARFP